jgi:hypothetical protein
MKPNKAKFAGMKRIQIIALSTVALLSGMMVQGQAREGSFKFDKENLRSVVINIDQPVNVTSAALNQRLQQSGLKAKTNRGVTRYDRVTLPELSPDLLDIYTKVEKGAGNTSTVYMAVGRGYNGLNNSPADSTITENIKNYLEAFVNDANAYSADLGINNQINEVNKEEKAYQRLLDEQGDLMKKQSDIASRLLDVQRQLKVKEDEINKKKSDLEIARAKRIN